MIPRNTPQQQIPVVPTAYVLDPEIVEEFGWTVAGIHCLLGAYDSGDGAQLSNKQIATLAHVSESTVKRTAKKLRAAGHLETEAIFKDNWQKANWNQIPTSARLNQPILTPGQNDPTPGQNDLPNKYLYTDTEVVINPELVEIQEEELVLEQLEPARTLDPAVGSQGLDACGVEGSESVVQVPSVGQPLDEEHEATMGTRRLPSIQDRPTMHGTRANVFDVDQLARYFEGFVEKQSTRKITQKRFDSWVWTAQTLLCGDHRPMAQVCDIIEWVFNDRNRGFCPVSGDKVTRLYTILDNYPQLLVAHRAIMAQPVQADEDVEGGDVEVEPDQAWVNPIDSYTEEEHVDLRRRLMAFKAS